MLSDARQFAIVEEALEQNGIIQRFEKDHGKITGRMMIALADTPDGLPVKTEGGSFHTFECSFDFYDTSLGICIDTKTLQVACGMWATPQKEDADMPSREWIEFFLDTLMSHISDDGSFGAPMYTFVNDVSDFTVVPTAP